MESDRSFGKRYCGLLAQEAYWPPFEQYFVVPGDPESRKALEGRAWVQRETCRFGKEFGRGAQIIIKK
jgi:hypothetical protein